MTSDLQARQAVRQERKVSQEVEDDSGAGRPLRFHILIILIHIMFRIIVIMTTIIIILIHMAYTQNTYGTNTYRYSFRR